LVFFQEIKKHQDVALLDQRGKCGLVGEKESTVFVSPKELLRERKSQSKNPLGVNVNTYSLRSLLTSLDRQLRIKQMVYGVLVTRGASDCA